MKTTDMVVPITDSRFGDALVAFMNVPARIIGVSVKIPKSIDVDFAGEPITGYPFENARTEFYDGMLIKLTKEEVFIALTRDINYNTRNLPFRGNQVKSLSVELPDEITFRLGYAPLGSNKDSHPHVFKALESRNEKIRRLKDKYGEDHTFFFDDLDDFSEPIIESFPIDTSHYEETKNMTMDEMYEYFLNIGKEKYGDKK